MEQRSSAAVMMSAMTFESESIFAQRMTVRGDKRKYVFFCKVYPVHHNWINYFVICMIYELCLARYSCIYFKLYRYDELSLTKLLLLPEAFKAKKLKVQGIIARPIFSIFCLVNKPMSHCKLMKGKGVPLFVCWLIGVFLLPLQVCPSPVYPALHVQEYEPTVFTQSALTSQLWVWVLHSSRSATV